MWILWKLRFLKREFCEKWDFRNVTFMKIRILEMWILQKLGFSICEFLDKLRILAPVCLEKGSQTLNKIRIYSGNDFEVVISDMLVHTVFSESSRYPETWQPTKKIVWNSNVWWTQVHSARKTYVGICRITSRVRNLDETGEIAVKSNLIHKPKLPRFVCGALRVVMRAEWYV